MLNRFEGHVPVGPEIKPATFIGGNWWVKKEVEPLIGEGKSITLAAPDSNVFTATLYPTPLTPLASFGPPKIMLIPLGALLPHEKHNSKNFKYVKFTPSWDDKPFVAGDNGDGKLILLDGAGRRGLLRLLYKNSAANLPVPVQVISFFHLGLDTWFKKRSLLLTKDQVLERARSGKFVRAKQTRFGAVVGLLGCTQEIYVSVAQVQPTIVFHQPLLPPHPYFESPETFPL